MWLALFVPFAAAQEKLHLAAVEVGTASGTLSDFDGVQARAEWSTGRVLHVGVQGSWNQGGAIVEPPYGVYADPWSSEEHQGHDIRALAALSAHLDDKHVQVGLGLAAGPWLLLDRDSFAASPLEDKVSSIDTETKVVFRAYWTTSVRVRITHGIGVYFATTGDLGTGGADASFGVGWTR